MSYNTIEQESIGLCICVDALDNILNHGLLLIRPVSSYPGEAEVIFKSGVHRDLFLVRLLDFVKEKTSRQLTGTSGSCLEVLDFVVENKSLDCNNSVTALCYALRELRLWLKKENKIKLWLPLIDLEADIFVSPVELLNISGNHSKHNLSRLTAVSRDVVNLFERNGYKVSQEEVPLCLDDLIEQISRNYFIYYSTWISELLNNLRWGIHDYLRPVFSSSYVSLDDEFISYRYEYPSALGNDIARKWYWNLMNKVRQGPCVERFVGAHYLKGLSSLEQQF